jgi:tetraacyldisaccharide 4'-kinase
MRLEPPRWWHGSSPADRLKAALLTPAGWLFGAVSRGRFALAKPYRSPLPVICVGNFTVGGAGKTPLALAVADIAHGMGQRPAFLTRGYGGGLAGPHRVAPERDSAADVGDEALLLARAAPTVVARARPAGAKAIEALGASLIIMDDGFQNPSLDKDVSIIAIDAGPGLGNGRVFPAGPLRAPLAFQRERASLAVLIGEGGGDIEAQLNGGPPLIRARLELNDGEWLRGARVAAFSGIGRPAKFFATLREGGAELVAADGFPDHHAFTEAEARALLRRANALGATLVTTEKDWVRIGGASAVLAELKATARALPVKLVFTAEDEARLRDVIAPRLSDGGTGPAGSPPDIDAQLAAPTQLAASPPSSLASEEG